MSLKNIAIIGFLFFTYLEASSQGGVNIEIIKIDSLNSSFLNKKVKIIFKDTSNTPLWSFTSKGKIKLKGKEIELISNHGRGVDYWYFNKAYLESENYQNDLTLRVYKSVIKEITKDSIQFQWKLQFYKDSKISDVEKCRKKKNHIYKYNIEQSICLVQVKSEITEISIPKKIIGSLLIKK